MAAQGRIAQQEADKRAREDAKRKEKADASYKAAIALRDQRIASLRHDADSRSAYSLPPAPAGSPDPTRACFDRAEFERATRSALEGLRKLADEGDEAITALNSARAWARP